MLKDLTSHTEKSTRPELRSKGEGCCGFFVNEKHPLQEPTCPFSYTSSSSSFYIFPPSLEETKYSRLDGAEGGDSGEAVGSVVSNSEGKCCPCVFERVELCVFACVFVCVYA